MSNVSITLTGLDGSNPLAFLAAIGVLRALDHRARQHARTTPRLSWFDEGCWRPVVHDVTSMDAIIGELTEDRETWEADPALLIAYDESGEKLVDPRKTKAKIARDLKPKPGAMREFIESIASQSAYEQTPRELLYLRRSLDTISAFGSELVQDNNGNTKPTGFHFTAGQQQFMKAVAELQAGVTATDLQEALVGPWRRESTLPNMSWDATNARFYALRATNPSGDKKTSVAGADWLAFVGLSAFPSFPRGSRLATTGITGGWKDSTLTWPVWRRPSTYRVAACLARIPDLARLSAVERASRGIGSVFRAKISRSDQGGYGSFAPAEVT